MSKNYVVYHCHSYYSNINGYADSCSDFKEYIKLAKKQNIKALAFSEHGNIGDWIKKKQACDKAGIKYIHGVELYLCHKLEDDDRGGHIGLYARNFDGVLELNMLMSNATSKGVLEDNSDRHMYYNPRISLQELMNTSDNIIFTSACLASPLNRWTNKDNENKEAFDLLLEWMTKNKHRCFLEIQYHNAQNQIEYNQKLHFISMKTGIPLIAGTDTHSSSKYKAECRKILQIYKKSFYGEEDEFDLVWKSYDEIVEAFKNQNSLSSDIYMQAIENTNKLADMVEDFKLDKAFKYPTLYGDNVKEQWKQLIYKCLEDKKNIGALDLVNCTMNDYKQKIKEEFVVMCKLGMESFMMFMSELLNWCKENNIPYGTGRGSVCGSMIAYITDITDVDPLVWKTVFSRFCNEDRISLGDIDVDFAPEDREKVYQYIINRFTPEKTAYIAAFSTLQDRGCIDVLAGGLGYSDLDKVMNIKNQFDEYFSKYSKIIQEEVDSENLVEEGILESTTINFDNHNIYMQRINNNSAKKNADKLKQLYSNLINDNQDLFYYLKGLKGTIVAKGTHPSGMIGSPITLADNVGLFYKDGNKNMPVSVCSMKAVDSLNYVKFDILGLKTVGIIKDACNYAGIPYPKSYELNWNDNKVWDNMITSKQGVFQFEGSDYAFGLLKDFKPTTINHMSMVNAALRPSGKSYRDRLIAGEFNKNPSKEIDKLLESNRGFLIFQEDTTKFLSDICGFSGSLADTTRRAIGKKDEELLKEQLPLIVDGYCNHSKKDRSIAEEEVKQFVQIISDSSEYQFGFNHSTAYSMNGYECVYLRTYYNIEFIASYLNRAENKEDTNNGVNLAIQYNISIHPIKFGKSLSEYTIDRDNNAIYKGILSIKYCNSQIANELMDLSKNKYNTFIDLLEDINSKTSVDSRQLKILTGLNFFSDFGKNKYLLNVIKIYNNLYNKKQINKDKLESLGLNEYLMKKYSNKETEKLYKELDIKGLTKELCSKLENKAMSIIEHIKFEMEYLEYTTYINPNVSEHYYVVVHYKTYKDITRPYIVLRNIKTGEEISTRITQGKIFKMNPFGEYSILKILDFDEAFKKKNVGGEWIVTSETEKILTQYEVIK